MLLVALKHGVGHHRVMWLLDICLRWIILHVFFDFVDEGLLSVEQSVLLAKGFYVGADQVLVHLELFAGALEGFEVFDEHVH